jgi:hypothetical protein
MGSEARRPGLTAGIEAILKEGFGVPGTPAIGREEALRRVKARLEAEGLRWQRLDISELPVSRNALVDMAGRRVPFPPGVAYDTCHVVLVDPDMLAQWGHPAWWAFVPSDGSGNVMLESTELPEHALGNVRFFLAARR